MENSVQKVLYVCSEMLPYTPEGEIATISRFLPQGTQEKKREIRAFMPRYGCINERKHQLHEVIRLSGMNLVISEMDHPLVIKVASIAEAHTQVYFIDNEDFFKRKGIFADADGKFYEDNGERAIFFARGVLETVKKLRWAPDVIHCHGWISHLLPLYLKKAYKDDPIFSNSKVVLSLYDDTPGKLAAGFAEKVAFGGLTRADVPELEVSDGINLAKTAVQYSDGIILGSADVDGQVVEFCKQSGLPILPFSQESIDDGSYMDEYNAFYDTI